LDGRPEIWRHLGNIAALAERAWLVVLAAENPLAVESMKRTLAEMKADLAGEQPTRLERMLVDQLVLNWLEVRYVESISADPGPGTLDQASFRLKRVESAERRYLTAVKTLSQIRALTSGQPAPAKQAAPDSPRLFDPDRQPESA
jgi:hypothetical protein